ncbi:hypothetical protein CC78DRAFT_618831 [Lojkania enalia]|uniref:Phospholipid/glycerol acyltransferase domain-containing protein n=1 Tax=Lojkania enalia TaxID=147567 RepID=A0A9P4N164_9PLEO|nr:hypothetical protein CC78DRAFT_618831 [Didymosphaeria enalia]
MVNDVQQKRPVSRTYRAAVAFLSLVTKIYLREFRVQGVSNIPRDGGLIIVAGPHSNQMLDPTVVMQALLSEGNRSASNIIPTVWMKTRIVGFLARCLEAIVLERPSDFQKQGSGAIYMTDFSSDIAVVHGIDTKFMSETKSGDTLFLPKFAGSVSSATIRTVMADNMLILKCHFHPQEAAIRKLNRCSSSDTSANITHSEGSPYYIAPKLDRSQLYTNIACHLTDGGSALIFPEGASHDTPGFIPLHVGAAIMALEEKLRNPHSVTAILPCGIAHSGAHIFRSKVNVHFGNPIRVSRALAIRYGEGKREQAISFLMEDIRKELLEAKQNAETVDNTLLRPEVGKPLLKKTLRSVQKRSVRSSPLLKHYELLRKLGLTNDHLMTAALTSKLRIRVKQMMYFSMLMITGALMLPGLLLYSPLIVPVEIYARRRAQFSTKLSPWRKAGLDTFATNRVIACIALLPAFIGLYLGLDVAWAYYMTSEATTFPALMAMMVTATFVVLGASAWVGIAAADKASDLLQSLRDYNLLCLLKGAKSPKSLEKYFQESRT